MISKKNLKLTRIVDSNINVYLNLAQAYEAEFSHLTLKMPNAKGIFEPDTLPKSPYEGYLLCKNKIPIGFCIVEIMKDVYDIAEFYIIPVERKNRYGFHAAIAIFEIYPGSWQVRQIQGADSAKAFWQKVISEYTKNKFSESVVSDPTWGLVTRQQFLTTERIEA